MYFIIVSNDLGLHELANTGGMHGCSSESTGYQSTFTGPEASR